MQTAHGEESVTVGGGSGLRTRKSECAAGGHDGSHVAVAVTVTAVGAEIIGHGDRVGVADLQKHLKHFAALRPLQRVQIGAEHGDLHGEQNLSLVPGALQGGIDGLHGATARLQALVQPLPNAAPILHHELVRRGASRHQLRYHDAVAEDIALLRVPEHAHEVFASVNK